MSNYNIYFFDSKGSWNHIGSVEGTKVDNLTNSNLPLAVHQMNDEVFKEIVQMQENQNDSDYRLVSKICGLTDDQMEFLFLGTMKYRRCTVYLVMQFSHKTLQVRFLAYGTDQVLHNGQSFGTSLENVNNHTLINEIQDLVIKRLNPCTLGINFTALKKIKEGDYKLFV